MNLTKIILIGYSLAGFASRNMDFASRDIDYSLLEDRLPKYLPEEVVRDVKEYVRDGGSFLYGDKVIKRVGNSLRISYRKD